MLDKVLSERVVITDDVWKKEKKKKKESPSGISLFSDSKSIITGEDLDNIDKGPIRPKFERIEESSSDSEEKEEKVMDSAVEFNFATGKFEILPTKEKKKKKSKKRSRKSQ